MYMNFCYPVCIAAELTTTAALRARLQQINMAIADEDIGQCRRHLKEWEQRGWRLNLQALEANAGDVAYAIPSPARRLSKNWVLDPVPRVAGGG